MSSCLSHLARLEPFALAVPYFPSTRTPRFFSDSLSPRTKCHLVAQRGRGSREKEQLRQPHTDRIVIEDEGFRITIR